MRRSFHLSKDSYLNSKRIKHAKIRFQLVRKMSEQKVVIVTGASRGIGRAIALCLGKKHKIVLVARSEDALREVEKEITSKGGHALALKADVTVENDVKKVINESLTQLGTIDVLINNAGIGSFKRVDQFTLEEFKHMFEVNVFGTFLFTKYVVPILISKKSGQIINISSVAGLTGFKGGTAYAATKFAVNGFTESLREDLKEYGIAVSVVCPGSVRTGFGGRSIQEKMLKDYLLEPDDVARTVEYLVEESETANTKLIELKPRRRKEFRGK